MILSKVKKMKIGQLGNIDINGKSALISVNPKIYTLSAIFSAAQTLSDEAYFIIDGNPSEEIFVEIRGKKEEDATSLAYKFNEELVNHIVYEQRDMQTKKIKKMIMQKMLMPEKYDHYIDKAILEKITKNECELKDDEIDKIRLE